MEKCTKCPCDCGVCRECAVCAGNCGCACKKRVESDGDEEEEPQSLEQGSIKYGPELIKEAFQEGIRQDEISHEKGQVNT